MPYPTSPARYLAPIALLAAALAIVLVLSSVKSDGGGSVSAPPTTANAVSHKSAPKLKHKTYVVKQGDTLSGIAAKTGVSLETIQTLNDSVEATSLHAGQKVKLAP